jgi:ABC-type lipoprotein release transport system permease subunit
MTRVERQRAVQCLRLLGFTPADIVRLFLIAGLSIPDLTQLRASITTER